MSEDGPQDEILRLFCLFFHKLNLVIFPAKVNRYYRYFVGPTPPSVLCRFL